MSLIAGVFHTDGRTASGERLEAVLDAYAHFGPDGGGVWVDGPVALGHRMLFGTPESLQERLPFATADGCWAITDDARIDNRDELFESLGIPPEEQPSTPDSTLILRAWRQWGSECPARLEGDFAFAVYDRRLRQLSCVRSAFSQTPCTTWTPVAVSPSLP